MKCPFCSHDNDISRRFQATFIDDNGNYTDRTLKFNRGFGKFIDKSISMCLFDLWECANCGALFSPPK